MNGYSRAVLWIGILLIIGNLMSNGGWSNFWKTITTVGKTTTSKLSQPIGTPTPASSQAPGVQVV